MALLKYRKEESHMKGSDFLQVLETFPGRMELKRTRVTDKLVLDYSHFNFWDINLSIRRPGFSVDIPQNEEIWFKLLSFLKISLENGEHIPPSKYFLTGASQKVAKSICKRFNEFFYDSCNKIQDITQIKLDDLIMFAQSGEALLD